MLREGLPLLCWCGKRLCFSMNPEILVVLWVEPGLTRLRNKSLLLRRQLMKLSRSLSMGSTFEALFPTLSFLLCSGTNFNEIFWCRDSYCIDLPTVLRKESQYGDLQRCPAMLNFFSQRWGSHQATSLGIEFFRCLSSWCVIRWRWRCLGMWIFDVEVLLRWMMKESQLRWSNAEVCSELCIGIWNGLKKTAGKTSYNATGWDTTWIKDEGELYLPIFG